MRISGICGVVLFSAALLVASSCSKNESSVDNAVESTKDALDIREHEKLKDAGEDVKEAVSDAAEGAKDAVNGK